MIDPKILRYTSEIHNDTYPAIAKASHHGRIVLITGASKGIGRATAISFAKAGAHTIIIAARGDLSGVEKEILAAAKEVGSSPRVLQVKLDVSDPDSVTKALSTVQQNVDKLDILINNAGYLETWLPVADADVTDWWKTWEINIKGVFLVTRAFLPLLMKSDTKTLLNVSSVGAHGVAPGASAYQTSKLALLRFTQFLAAEYEAQGLVALALHPGGILTDLADNMPEKMHQILIDTPELAADTFAWITQERQPWLNGRYISATWDMPEIFARKDEIVNGDKLKVKLVL